MQAKRWISGLVACAMMATMLPVQAFAAGIDSTPESPATWERRYDADELYALVKDNLNENASIELSDMVQLDAIAQNESDDGQMGQLNQVSFDDDIVELSSLDGVTSYTLTFADEASTEEGALPEEPESNPPASEAETGTVVDQPGEAAPENDPAETPDPTGPPEGTDDGQEGDTTLTVTETKEDTASDPTQTGEGTVDSAKLTVDEKTVETVVLTYTEIVAEDDAKTQDSEEPQTEDGTPTEEPAGLEGTNALQTANWGDPITIKIEVGETISEQTIADKLNGKNPKIQEITPTSETDIVKIQEGRKGWSIQGVTPGTTNVSVTYVTRQWIWNGFFDRYWKESEPIGQEITITVIENSEWDIPTGAIPEDTSDGETVVTTEKTPSIPEDATPGQWDITMTATAEKELTQQSQEVVLLLDTSGSMAWCTDPDHDHKWANGGSWCGNQDEDYQTFRMKVAKEAATELIDTLAERGLNVKVAVTEFNGSSWTGGYASTVQRLSDLTPGNVEKLTEAIDKLKADGATYMFTGLQEAANAFSSNSTKKTIIMLADGDYDGANPVLFAQALQRANVSIYTVGFMTKNETLQSIASDEEHYFTANDMDSLLDNFQTIANQLSAMINDPLGEDVSLVGAANDVKVSIGNNNASSEGVKYDEEDNLITWNPDLKEDIDSDDSVEMTYKVEVNPDKIVASEDVQEIALNGDATFNYFYTGDGEATHAGSAPFDPPTGYYTAGQLVEKYVDEAGNPVKINGESQKTYDPVIVSWGTEEKNLTPSNAEFAWDTLTIPEDYVSVKTYYADVQGDIDRNNPVEGTTIPATAGTTTIYHVFSKEPVQKDSQIKVEVYLDGAENAERDSSQYVNVYNTKNGSDTEVSREKGNLYKFQYEQYDSMDTKITLVQDSQYVIDAVETRVIHGEKGFNANESEVHPTEAVIDNVAGTKLGNNVVKVYLRTKYSVEYYQDDKLLEDGYTDSASYVAAREIGAKTSYDGYETKQSNNISPLPTKVQSAGLSTTISLKPLPTVEADQTISGWFANKDVTSGEPTYTAGSKVNVSEHADRAEAGVIPFYARTAAATAMLTVKMVDGAGTKLQDDLTEEVTINSQYSVAIGTPADATITAPKTITTKDGKHYAYMELGENSALLTGMMPVGGATVTLVYGVDEIGGEDPENPGDGIPDRYQFTIEYVVADGQEAMGTVSPVGKNVYTIYQDGVLSAGPVTVPIDGKVIKAGVATAHQGYVFENWTLNDVDLPVIGVNDDLTGYQMIGVTGGQTYTFVAHFTKNYTVQDILYSFVKKVTLANGVENFPASAEFKFALTKEGGSPTYEATTGEVSGMTAEKTIPIVTYATDILADGTYYLTETVMDAGWTLTTPADGYKITIDHGTMSVNGEPVMEGETFAFENTYNGAPSLEVEKTVVDAEGKPVSDNAVYRDGDPVYFKIAVTAKGGWPAEDVTVTDTLPAGLTVDAQAIQYPEFHNFRGSLTNVDGKTVEIRINTATPTEDTVWVIIPAIVDAPETYDANAYTNIAVIDDGDPDTEDPSGETTIQVEAVSVVKALTPNNSPYNIGQTAQYYIVVTNTGNTVLHNLTVTEQLPEGLQLTDSEVNKGWNNSVYTIGSLKPGESYPIWAEVQITNYAESYRNVVVVRDAETDLGQAEDDTLEANPNYTVTVRYEWQNAFGATLGNQIKSTLEAAYNSQWKASVSDGTADNLTNAANLVVAKTLTVDGKHYAFKGFKPAQTSGSVTDDVTITAIYGLDEIGTTTDPENPDNVPDEYQATVTYRVVNGTWSDGTSADRSQVFTLYTYDPDTATWTKIENVALGDTIPTGMQANAGYVGQSGAWNTAITAETPVTHNVTYTYRFGEAAPNEIIVYYDDDGSGYGEVTSPHRQVFTAGNWETITGDPTHVRIHLTATAEDDGGRTYFNEWQGSLVDDLDDDIREDEDLDVWVVAEIGQTYTVIADFGRRSSGGGGGGGGNRDDDDEEEIIDEEVPLAETPWLNTVDHYAYIVGYAEDGTVRPNANITRAEVATIFFRLLTDEARNSLWSTTNTFSDVASTAWYNTAVSTMANAGIIQGYEDGTFRPNANITRAEFAAIAARFMTSGYDVDDDLFTDIAGHWARDSINDAATAGWINGYADDTFRPDNAITRAEAVTLVNNVLQRKPDADHMLDSMITWPDNPESAWYYEAIQEATNSHDYDMPSEDDDVDYEIWTALQENRDWAALEAQWSAEHAYGGDVM